MPIPSATDLLTQFDRDPVPLAEWQPRVSNWIEKHIREQGIPIAGLRQTGTIPVMMSPDGGNLDVRLRVMWRRHLTDITTQLTALGYVATVNADGETIEVRIP